MKRFARYTQNIYFIYMIPAMILHELCHLFFMLLFYPFIDIYWRTLKIKFWKVDGVFCLECGIRIGASKWLAFIIAFAPYMGLITFLVIFMHNGYVFFYLLTSFPAMLPSSADRKIMLDCLLDRD